MKNTMLLLLFFCRDFPTLSSLKWKKNNNNWKRWNNACTSIWKIISVLLSSTPQPTHTVLGWRSRFLQIFIGIKKEKKCKVSNHLVRWPILTLSLFDQNQIKRFVFIVYLYFLMSSQVFPLLKPTPPPPQKWDLIMTKCKNYDISWKTKRKIFEIFFTN